MVKSAGRVMQILKTIGAKRDGLKHSEIARALEIPKGSLSFLLTDLVDEEFLSLDSDGRYRIGPQILVLANHYLAGLDIVNLSYPIFRRIIEETNESVGLAVPAGMNAVIVSKMSAQQQLKMEFDLGESFPMYASAAGKAILAFYSDEEIERYLSEVDFMRITPNTVSDEQRLRSELGKIRAESISYSYAELFTDRAALAAPVFGNDGRVTASISQVIPSIRYTEEKANVIRQALLTASKELSRKLGYM